MFSPIRIMLALSVEISTYTLPDKRQSFALIFLPPVQNRDRSRWFEALYITSSYAGIGSHNLGVQALNLIVRGVATAKFANQRKGCISVNHVIVKFAASPFKKIRNTTEKNRSRSFGDRRRNRIRTRVCAPVEIDRKRQLELPPWGGWFSHGCQVHHAPPNLTVHPNFGGTEGIGIHGNP